MRTLADLLASVDGRQFLEDRGVLVETDGFLDAMAPPRRDELRSALGLPPGSRLPYVGQQLQCDYPRSVTDKFRLLRSLRDAEDVIPVTVPLDMDRAGSSKWNTTLTWPDGDTTRTARLIPHRLAQLEVRVAPVEQQRLAEVRDTVDGWLSDWSGEGPRDERIADRHAGFVAALTEGPPGTLAEVNRALTSWLLRDALAFQPPSMLVSELVAQGLLTEQIGQVVTHIDEVITVFNQAIADLIDADVDPKVRPLPPDYLPLRYTCPQDGRRGRLVRERHGTDTVAAMTCEGCGTAYRFHLGSRLSIDELAATAHWSTDVTLPMHLTPLVSGVVAGQSTALYGLVLNRVIEQVLGGAPVPALVPARGELEPDDTVDSLFFACLTASV